MSRYIGYIHFLSHTTSHIGQCCESSSSRLKKNTQFNFLKKKKYIVLNFSLNCVSPEEKSRKQFPKVGKFYAQLKSLMLILLGTCERNAQNFFYQTGCRRDTRGSKSFEKPADHMFFFFLRSYQTKVCFYNLTGKLARI